MLVFRSRLSDTDCSNGHHSMPTRAQVSKEEHTANVVLCTSDAAFLAWLEKGELLDRVVAAAHPRTASPLSNGVQLRLRCWVACTERSSRVYVSPSLPDSHAFLPTACLQPSAPSSSPPK